VTGGEDAFRALYRAHTPALYALALRLTGSDQSEAEDLVQETWVRATRKMSAFRGESALRTWLCGVLVNVRRERVRSAWRVVGMLDVAPAAPARDDTATFSCYTMSMATRIARSLNCSVLSKAHQKVNWRAPDYCCARR
jgi:RNA polymerase sigma-70 factor, ECF subfamily